METRIALFRRINADITISTSVSFYSENKIGQSRKYPEEINLMQPDKHSKETVILQVRNTDTPKNPGLGTRICLQAFWYLLIGPLVGLIGVGLIGVGLSLFFANHEDAIAILIAVLIYHPIAYMIGAVPALLTGVLMACLPISIRENRLMRTGCGVIIGGIVSGIFAWLSFSIYNHSDNYRTYSDEDLLIVITFLLGGFAGGLTTLFTPKYFSKSLKNKLPRE